MSIRASLASGTGTGARSRVGVATRFVALAVIWGMSFLFIKVGDESFAPTQVTLGRVAFGAAALLVILLGSRQRLPRGRRTWAHLAVAAVILNVVPFSLFAYAEQHVSSVLAGICNATAPLFTVAVAVLALPDERPTRRRILGLATGFVGVLIVLGAWHGVAADDLVGALLALGAACCYGIGWAYLRRFLTGTDNSAVSLSAGQLLAGTVELAILVPLVSDPPRDVAPMPLLAVAALGVFGTGLAYALQYSLIRSSGATMASTVTYCVPIVSTAAGILILHEHLTWYIPVGAAVIIAGAFYSRKPT